MLNKLLITIAGFLLAIVILSGCSSKMQNHSSSAIVCKHRMRSLESTEVLPLSFAKDAKILYRNNFVIEERTGASFNTDSTGKDTVETFTDRYTFINLSTKEHYIYKHFSDTAKPIRIFSHPDSIKADGGWNFFGLRGKEIFRTGGTPISDSLIDGVNYKRIFRDTAYTDKGITDSVRHIAYLRCDYKGMFTTIEKELSKRYGCPVVRTDWINLKTKVVASFELEVVSNNINAEEAKVFDAWERNAKGNTPLRMQKSNMNVSIRN